MPPPSIQIEELKYYPAAWSTRLDRLAIIYKQIYKDYGAKCPFIPESQVPVLRQRETLRGQPRNDG